MSTADRVPQLSWARGWRVGVSGRRLLEAGKGCVALRIHLAKPWRTYQKQAIYAASQINQLRKSSSAASQFAMGEFNLSLSSGFARRASLIGLGESSLRCQHLFR